MSEKFIIVKLGKLKIENFVYMNMFSFYTVPGTVFPTPPGPQHNNYKWPHPDTDLS